MRERLFGRGIDSKMESYDLIQNFTIGSLAITPVHVRIELLRPMIAAHKHSHTSYEIHYTAKGKGTAVIEGIRYPVYENILYVTGPDVEHAQMSDPVDPVSEYCLYLNCRQSRGKTLDSSMKLFKDTKFWFGEDTEGIFPVLRQLIEEQRNPHPDSGEMTEALLRQILVLLTRSYRKSSSLPENSQKKDIRSEAQMYPAIEDAFFYGHQSIQLDDLAQMLHLSHRQTQRFLQEHYGMTFSQKRAEARMAAAAQMLLNTNMTISEIAEKVGFSSGEHFSNAFRRQFHTAPSYYRKVTALAQKK